jgi:uncharacterized protein YbaA (DUF1428 family)
MEPRTYKNRYGDEYTFTRDENHDILWEGEFKWCRFGMPNDYTRAYEAYCNDVETPIPLEEFKKAVHHYDDETLTYDYPEYVKMVDSLVNEIDMIDPSGGPYISRDMPLDSFGFKKYVVKDFKRIDTGYKIITEKCAYCNQAGGVHKMGCETRKIQIHL